LELSLSRSSWQNQLPVPIFLGIDGTHRGSLMRYARWNAYTDWVFCPTVENSPSDSFLGFESRMLDEPQTKPEIGMYIGLGTLLLVVLAIWFFRRA
jgi:hypothetical protein